MPKCLEYFTAPADAMEQAIRRLRTAQAVADFRGRQRAIREFNIKQRWHHLQRKHAELTRWASAKRTSLTCAIAPAPA